MDKFKPGTLSFDMITIIREILRTTAIYGKVDLTKLVDNLIESREWLLDTDE